MKKYIVIACGLMLAATAFAHDDDLGALAPSCIVDSSQPFGAGPELARIVTLDAVLSNLAENPAILDRSASGSVRVLIRFERPSAGALAASRAVVNAQFRFRVAQAETITNAHIHPGIVGANGGIAVPLSPAARFDVAAGEEAAFQAQFEVTDQAGLDALGRIADSPEDFYANVHSVAKPGGLLRGQLHTSLETDAACLRSAMGAMGQQVASIATVAGAVGEGLGSLQSELAALKAAAASIQTDVNALKTNAGVAGLSQDLKLILRLVVLSAARDGVIGAGERDQLLAAIQ